MTSVILVILFYAQPAIQLPRGPLLCWLPLAGAGVAVWRRVFSALNCSSYLKQRTVLLGDGPLASPLASEIGRRPELGINLDSSQRTGDTIHSPKHCLPGAGWVPGRAGDVSIPLLSDGSVTVNDYLIQKGRDKQLVLYWCQARGRTIASEYWAKLWMVLDALRRHRTDGALVRVIAPTGKAESEARERAVEFVRSLYPRLKDFIPN